MPGESAADKVENIDLESIGGESRGAEDSSSNGGKGSDTRGPEGGTPGAKAATGQGTSPNGAGADEAKGGSDEDDDEGYIADELDVPEDDYEPEEVPASNVSPELKYIVDNLPTLSVRGRTSPNGALKTFNVKAAGQLPDSFEFATDKERATFTQALAAQENKAQQLQAEFQSQQQRRQADQYIEQENTDIRNDIASLQREGLLPKFRYEPGDRRFDSDEGVKAAQEVLEFMNEKNGDYAKAGRLYRISYRDAYDMLARDAAKAERTNKQRTEDRERTEVNRQLRGGGSAPRESMVKARPAGSMQELLDRIEMMD